MGDDRGNVHAARSGRSTAAARHECHLCTSLATVAPLTRPRACCVRLRLGAACVLSLRWMAQDACQFLRGLKPGAMQHLPRYPDLSEGPDDDEKQHRCADLST